MGRRPSVGNGSPRLFLTDAFARVGHVEAAPGSADLTIAADRPADVEG